jgi:hypothetical protein
MGDLVEVPNFVLRRPNLLCGLLVGPRKARSRRSLACKPDRRTVERSIDIRLGCVRRNYGSEREDWADYHMIIDSTAINLDTLANIIVDASLARRQQATISTQR